MVNIPNKENVKALWDSYSKLDHLSELQVVQVQLAQETFFGVRMKQRNEYQAGMDAVTRGDKKAGEEYFQVKVVLLGNLPKDYQKSQNVCYMRDTQTWYVASYGLKENITPATQQYHPGGISFMLMQWEGIDEEDTIDRFERFPYKRKPMELTELPNEVIQ